MSKQPLFTVTADWHLHDWGEFNTPPMTEHISPRLKMQLDRLVNWIAGCGLGVLDLRPTAIVLGDVVHRRSPMIAHEVASGLSTMRNAMRNSFQRIIVLAGNHDFPEDKATPLSAVNHLRDTNIATLNFPESLPKEGLAFLPWGKYTPEELRAKVEELHEGLALNCPRKILFTHFPTKEAISENGKSGFGKYSVQDFLPDKWDLIISGDIHKHQKIGKNFWYVGAPYQLTRGDMGDSKKGYLVIYDDLSVEHKTLSSPSMEHVSVLVDSPKFSFLTMNPHDLPTIYVKRGTADYDEVVKKAKEFFVLPPVVTWADLGPSKKAKIKALPKDTEPHNPVSVLNAYLSTRYTGALDRELLFEYGKSILEKTGASRDKYAGPVYLERIVAKNFMAYRELDAPLEGQGIVLVDGRNDDAHEVFRANAVGKSTLMEAIYFGLYGKTLRGLRDSEIPNQESGEDWFSTEIVLRTSRHRIRILRTRNDPKIGSGVTLFLDDVPFHSEGRKRDESTEAQIDAEIGISSRLFRSAVLFGQNVQSLFAAGTDKDRKEILSELTPIDAYIEGEVLADEQQASLASDIGKWRMRLEAVRSLASEQESSLVQAMEEEAKGKLAREERLDSLRERAQVLHAEIEALNERIFLLPPCPMPSPAAVPDDSKLLELRQRESSLSINRGNVMGKEELLRKQKAQWAALALEGRCHICGGAITQEKHDHAMAPVAQELVDALKFLAKADPEIAEVRALIALELSKMKQFRDAENARYSKDWEAYTNWQREDKELSMALKGAQKDLVTTQGTIKEIEENNEPLKHVIERLKSELEALGNEEDELLSQIAKSDAQMPYLNTIKTLFGKQGLRTFVFDFYSDDIEKEANRALEVLTDGILSLSLGAKRGATTIKESIGFSVHNRQGSDKYAGFSGAERRLVDLALLWALFMMLNRVNILSTDEALDVLDEAAAPRTFELLRMAAEAKNCTVFCITHRADIKPLCENVWTVVKSGQSARILLGREAL